jgi:phage-related protein (TIGR01555 family)
MTISKILARVAGIFRRKPVPPTASQVIAQQVIEPLKGWSKSLLGRLEADSHGVQREPTKLKLPEIMKGVRGKIHKTKEEAVAAGIVLAMDSGYEEQLAAEDNTPAAWGFNAVAASPGLTYLGAPYLAELAQISEYRIPAESLSTEMTRTWGKLVSKSNDPKAADKIKDLTADIEKFKLRDLFRQAALKTEWFGRGHLYISVEGQDDDRNRQVPLTEVGKGKLLGFACIEPYWLTPYSWNSTHPERPDFYKPQSWYVLGRKTHSTRILTFIFREVPDLLKPAYDFGGISITQLMMPYVTRWLRTAKSVNDLINIFSVVTLATDLNALLAEETDSPKGLLARLQGFIQARDNKGAMLVNKDTEELQIQNVPLSGLDKLQAQSQEHMATPGRMPLIKFFGIVPAGLGSGKAEGEFQSWYDYVHALQELGYMPNLKIALDYIQMNRYGKVDDDLTWEWNSLWEPTPKEEADIRKADAERDGAYLDRQVVTQDEVRDKLRNDPESGYNGLQGKAPDPMIEQEHQLGQEGAEADADRQEQSAQAGHERAKELAAAKPAPGGKK